MIKLRVEKEPRWLVLEHGLQLQARPMTSLLMETARHHARTVITDLRTSLEHVRAARVAVEEGPDLSDPSVLHAHFTVQLCKSVARYAVIDWKGVAGEDGQPLAFSHEAMALLLDVDAVSTEFFTAYLQAFLLRDDEKNG